MANIDKQSTNVIVLGLLFDCNVVSIVANIMLQVTLIKKIFDNKCVISFSFTHGFLT